jgi:CRP/FNR family transcriptional regulator
MTSAVAKRGAMTDGIHSLLPCGSCEVRANGVCNGVSRPDLPRLAALATIVEVSRGQTFILEDAPAEHFCILILGSAKLYKLLPDGRRQIIGFAYSGSFLGLAVSEGYAFSAEAIEPIRMCRMSRARLQTVLSDFRTLERRLLDVAVHDLVRAQEQMLLLGRKTVSERVASFLVFQTTRPQPRDVRWPRIHLPMSRIDIADYLGVTVETISRALAKLRECGVIAIPNVHELVIIDLPRLEALAHGALSAESRRRRTARHLGSADTRTCSGPVMPPLSDRPEFDENLTSVN